MKTIVRYALISMSLLCVVSVLRTLRYRSGLELGWRSRDPSDGSLSYITPEEQHLLSSSPLASDINEDLSKCTMTSCFDLSRCVYQKEFKVYVYPPSNLSTVSTVYSNILKVIRESSLYTDSPQRACVFVLSIDTIDRDRISENYVKRMNDLISTLPTDIWNNGRNHVIFNLYHGTYPDYSDHDLGFDVGYAIIARASANAQVFRRGFDLSFPLFHKEHPLRTTVEPIWPLKMETDYLISFKGKRYVYGIGSETRDSLYHLHDGHSVVMVTTCKHNTDWKKYEDERCEEDNVEYERWDYQTIMSNSTFCLTPRGRRLGSFRFLEALRLGCIPVVLSDDWVLPFSEVIDWSQAAVVAYEDAVLTVTDVLKAISLKRVMHMKQMSRILYWRYFSSVEKIVLTSLQLVGQRIKGQSAKQLIRVASLFPQLSPTKHGVPQAALSFLILGAHRNSGKLQKIGKILESINNVKQIIILWPSSRGHFRQKNILSRSPVEVIDLSSGNESSFFLETQYRNLLGDFVFMIDERVPISKDDIIYATKMLWSNRDQLLGFYSHNQEIAEKSPNTASAPADEYSFVLPHFAAVHSYYFRTFWQWLPKPAIEIAEHYTSCYGILFNCYVTETSGRAPILVEDRFPEGWMRDRNYSKCLEKLAELVWPSGLSLLRSRPVHPLKVSDIGI